MIYFKSRFLKLKGFHHCNKLRLTPCCLAGPYTPTQGPSPRHADVQCLSFDGQRPHTSSPSWNQLQDLPLLRLQFLPLSPSLGIQLLSALCSFSKKKKIVSYLFLSTLPNIKWAVHSISANTYCSVVHPLPPHTCTRQVKKLLSQNTFDYYSHPVSQMKLKHLSSYYILKDKYENTKGNLHFSHSFLFQNLTFHLLHICAVHKKPLTPPVCNLFCQPF